MINLKCQQCGAALHWDGQGNVVQCGYCGAEYLIHPRREKFRKKADPYKGTGTVQGIPIVQGTLPDPELCAAGLVCLLPSGPG